MEHVPTLKEMWYDDIAELAHLERHEGRRKTELEQRLTKYEKILDEIDQLFDRNSVPVANEIGQVVDENVPMASEALSGVFCSGRRVNSLLHPHTTPSYTGRSVYNDPQSPPSSLAAATFAAGRGRYFERFGPSPLRTNDDTAMGWILYNGMAIRD